MCTIDFWLLLYLKTLVKFPIWKNTRYLPYFNESCCKLYSRLFSKEKNDEEFSIEDEIPKLTGEKLSQLWLNCKVFIGEAILHIIDQSSSDDVPEHPPEKVLSACLLIAKTTVEKIELEHIPESLEQFVCFFAFFFTLR